MPGKWFAKELGDGVDAAAPRAEIQKTFKAAYVSAGKPPGMAVFTRYDLEANVVSVYFTPEAAFLASVFSAHSCDKPPAEGIGLLVGDDRAWEIYFPGRRRGT